MELFSVFYFQTYLGMYPCEYCAKIRLAMIVIFMGAALAAIYPKWLILKIIGYGVTLTSAAWGLYLSAVLEGINLRALSSGWLPPCSSGRITWPLGLKLDQWWPRQFRPDGICGEDSQWFFLGFSMTQWLIVIYTFMITGLTLMLIAHVTAKIKAARAKAGAAA
jgi:disulfide bond formation protein DsbB